MLEGSQGLRRGEKATLVIIEGAGTEDLVEALAIGWIGPQCRDHGSRVRHPHLDRVQQRLAGLGHEIDGTNVYANVSDTKYVEEGRWEAHKKYADIQVNLDGGELSGCRPTALTADWEPYNAEKDAMMSDDPRPGFRVPLTPGCFAVFFPQDAHMPCLSDGTRSHGRKVVVKVRVD